VHKGDYMIDKEAHRDSRSKTNNQRGTIR